MNDWGQELTTDKSHLTAKDNRIWREGAQQWVDDHMVLENIIPPVKYPLPIFEGETEFNKIATERASTMITGAAKGVVALGTLLADGVSATLDGGQMGGVAIAKDWLHLERREGDRFTPKVEPGSRPRRLPGKRTINYDLDDLEFPE